MVDPTRRKRLAGSAAPELRVVSTGRDEGFLVRSYHAKNPGSFDFEEFAVGRPSTMEGRGSGGWTKGFRGRPQLMQDLLSTLRRRCRQSTRSVITQAVPQAFRVFWRWLDTLDEVDGLKVDSLADLNDLHGSQFLRFGPSYSEYVAIKGYVVDARKDQGLPPVFWAPPPERKFTHSDVPSKEVMRAAYSELKRNVYQALQRWEDAARLAQTGFNWAGCDRPVTKGWDPADVQATLRGIIEASGDPVPGRLTVSRFLRKTEESLRVFPGPWGPARALYTTLYPSKADAQNFLYLFLLRTGWNAQVALALDISTPDWSRPHPTSADHVLVYSTKSRGNTVQVHPSRVKGQLEAHNLIRALLKQTAPLRAKAKAQLDALEVALAADPGNAELDADVAVARATVRSPWLFFDSKDIGKVQALSLENYLYKDGKTQAWTAFIKQHNERVTALHARQVAAGETVAAPTLLPGSLQLSDLRDAFVSHAYAASGYSWLMAKLAAGHTSVRSMQNYLRHRQWRAFGEKQIHKVQESLWSEVKVHRRVEPAFLRALVERGDLSEEQRQRWLARKDRTRMGTGCRDFTHPPEYLAPEHQEGAGCRVQRCVLCPHAVVFDDSLPALTRRKAELLALQEQVPVATWLESSFPDELEALDATLADFDADAVGAQLQHWQTEITAGRHRVLQFEGAYA